MTWYNLKLKGFDVKITPLNPIEREYPYCDKDKNLLRKVAGKFDKGYFVNDENGEQHDKAFRLINGKALAEIPKTKDIPTEKIKEVDVGEVEDLLVEKTYLVENDILLTELKEKGKAYKFGFSNGRGFKGYKTYLYPSKIYKNYLIMVCGTTQISEVIQDLEEVKAQSKKLKEVALTIQGIDTAKVEDLIEI